MCSVVTVFASAKTVHTNAAVQGIRQPASGWLSDALHSSAEFSRLTTAIEFRDVSRIYGAVRAVDGISLSVDSGEFFAMLGPSGSGKTTCLRLIAGFEAPDNGAILLEGADVTSQPPYERDVNTVFQDYALFPHMSVLENVAYGPRVRGELSRQERHARALQMLEMVRLAEFGDRRPSQLSGGQRQRVALARALINKPKVLLLDEPLSALDLKLREAMQIELKALQRALGITFVFVTHDQGEALSMADRIAVFNEGRIEQLATPRELYTRPATAFVARFVGGANVIEPLLAEKITGAAICYALRPERVRLTKATESTAPHPNNVGALGTIVDTQFHGATVRCQVRLEGGEMLSASTADVSELSVGINDRVLASWTRGDMVELPGA
jgi:putative spermidine/putrescine transport system ATP-binding protein